MAASKPRSLKAIVRQRQKAEFVGRAEQLASFQQNLSLRVEDPERRFVFGISGDGGVGKSTLLGRFQQMAEEAGTLTGRVDETERDLPEVLVHLARQLDRGGSHFRALLERERKLRELQHKMEAEPGLPDDTALVMGDAAGRFVAEAVRQVVPGSKAVVNDDVVAGVGKQAGKWSQYVIRKLGNKDEVELVEDPAGVLTPLFVEGLRALTHGKQIGLFFDTYERTCEYLDGWLRALLDDTYGELPPDIVLVVAGRHPLDKNAWADWEGIVLRVPLRPFTSDEAREFLAGKGITDARTVEVILVLSQRVPLFVSMLAESSPNDPSQVGDATGLAVDRYLMWETDPARRAAAVAAALPRHWNRDVLGALLGEEQAAGVFEWLRRQPFVEEHRDRWTYHAEVRPQMLAYQRRESEATWIALQQRLVDYYDGRLAYLGLSKDEGLTNGAWQRLALEDTYHALCAGRQQALTAACGTALELFDVATSLTGTWGTMMEQAGRDSDSSLLMQWGKRVTAFVQAYKKQRYSEAAHKFGPFIEDLQLNEKLRALAFFHRGDMYVDGGMYDQALIELNQALALDSTPTIRLKMRAYSYAQLQRYDDALIDLNLILAREPADTWTLRERGVTYRLLERYDEALADLTQTVTLDRTDSIAIMQRGYVYRELGRYNEALADFTQVVALDPHSSGAFSQRGNVFRILGRSREALADFDRAVELDPQVAKELRIERGLALSYLGRYEEAIQEYQQELVADPDSLAASYDLAVVLARWQGREAAEAAIQRTEMLLTKYEADDPESGSVAYGRGGLAALRGEVDRALAYLADAITAIPESRHWARHGVEWIDLRGDARFVALVGDA